MKKRVYEIVEAAAPGNRASQAFDIFIVSLITLNAVALIVGTVEEIHELSPLAFRIFEIVSVAIFTVEYLLRVWSCTIDPRYDHPVFGRLRFIVSPMTLIDLLAILPFYMVLFVNLHGLDLRFLRAVRLLARVARMGRYSSGLCTLARVVYAKRSELLTVIMVLSVLLLMTSSLIFFAEKEAQPEKFANIPQDYVVEYHHSHYCRLRRRISGHRRGTPASRPDSDSGDRTVCFARGYPGVLALWRS